MSIVFINGFSTLFTPGEIGKDRTYLNGMIKRDDIPLQLYSLIKLGYTLYIWVETDMMDLFNKNLPLWLYPSINIIEDYSELRQVEKSSASFTVSDLYKDGELVQLNLCGPTYSFEQIFGSQGYNLPIEKIGYDSLTLYNSKIFIYDGPGPALFDLTSQDLLKKKLPKKEVRLYIHNDLDLDWADVNAGLVGSGIKFKPKDIVYATNNIERVLELPKEVRVLNYEYTQIEREFYPQE